MRKNIKLLLEAGLTTLCNHIKDVKATAEQSGSAVAALAENTAASLEEIDGLFSTKQDKATSVPFTIPADGWAETTGSGEGNLSGYAYCYDLTAPGVTAKDRADVVISPGSMDTALDCGICPTNESLDGIIRLRAANKPDEPITAEYWVYSGKE